MRHRLLLLFILVGFFCSSKLSAKKYNPYGTDWAIGVHFGGTSFFGDLRSASGGLNSTPFSKYFYKDMRLMGGFSLEKWFGAYMGMDASIQYGKLQGTKETSDAWFETNILEYNMSVTANLSNIFMGVSRRRHWMVYTSIGMGMTESRTWKYQISSNKLIGTNGFGKPRKEGGAFKPMTETIIPFALGGKLFIGSNLSINIEGSFHTIYSDKLDATPNDNSSFIAGIEGYTYYSIGMQYWFGLNGYHISNQYRGRSRYNGGRSGYVKINSRKTSRRNNRIFRKGRKRFKFTRR